MVGSSLPVRYRMRGKKECEGAVRGAVPYRPDIVGEVTGSRNLLQKCSRKL